ncbi:restriction endonuclease [Pseudomonas sp. 2FG]|uniref:restriction endonuclease n=1 Tax=Pseudomonas sp. 2FG TaxID=2502191 RepID=UPI0010FA4C1C|nr:restriction endonuclease [Pseudomonas sp. 2FG]
MPIPDFQTLMRPLLELHKDGLEHLNRDLVEKLAEQFSLTEDERREMLPSGRAKLFDNRVGWAKTYISNAGLIQSPRRAISVITTKGIEALRQKEPINLRFLKSVIDSQNSTVAQKQKKSPTTETTNLEEATPEESFENAYLKVRQEVEQDILKNILNNPPEFLERLVVDLVVKMGYGGSRKDAGEAIGRSGDEGIDGIIKEDPLGLDIIYLQAKRYEGTVGRPDIQKFAGALQGQRAKKGIFITTSSYSKEALDYVSKIDTKIILIDGKTLAKLMFHHGVGVSTSTIYEVKKIDTDYFSE